MIVECALPGFRVEPSQGTHFFQNITSLGVGYLSVDTVSGEDGIIDFQAIASLSEEQGNYRWTRVMNTGKELVAYIDHKNNRAVAGLRTEEESPID